MSNMRNWGGGGGGGEKMVAVVDKIDAYGFG